MQLLRMPLSSRKSAHVQIQQPHFEINKVKEKAVLFGSTLGQNKGCEGSEPG